MASWMSKLGRKPDARQSLFRTCTVCKDLCEASKLLNDVDFCSLVRKTGEKAFGDSYKREPPQREKLPEFFVDRIKDCNQWNEWETYVFEDEFPHHASGAALELSAKNKCHLCSLLWSHFSTVRYGIMEQEVDIDLSRRMEESRQEAKSLVLAAGLPLFARVGIKIGSQGGYITIVLYAGQQKENLPEVRSALAVWRTEGVSGRFSPRIPISSSRLMNTPNRRCD